MITVNPKCSYIFTQESKYLSRITDECNFEMNLTCTDISTDQNLIFIVSQLLCLFLEAKSERNMNVKPDIKYSLKEKFHIKSIH